MLVPFKLGGGAGIGQVATVDHKIKIASLSIDVDYPSSISNMPGENR